MGCGGSKPVVPPEPLAEQPPPPEPEPEPPKEVEETTSLSASPADADALPDGDVAGNSKAGEDDAGTKPEPEPEPEPPQQEPEPEPEPKAVPVYIVEDSSAVPGLGLQLGFLEHLASELGRNATAADLLQQVVLPQTADARSSAGSSASSSSGGGRFADLHKQQVSSPTYYVKQQWLRSFKEMMNVIKEHIHSMEPDVPVEQVSIWMDMLALNQHHAEQRQADLKCVQGALASAKTTLVVMEKQAAQPNQVQPPAHADSPVSPGAPSPGAAPGMQQPEQSVCLVMYRAKEGLHGFHPFNSVHVKYL